jgi:hypothetical protein
MKINVIESGSLGNASVPKETAISSAAVKYSEVNTFHNNI